MYLDPGTGSMIIQVLIALAVAGGGTLAIFRGRIKNIFRRWRKRK